MSWQMVRLDEVPAAPWRNGGGVTRELVAWPNDQYWQWRASVADVDRDGPFSAYPGVHRWFAVLEGAGVTLEFEQDGRRSSHRITASDQPLLFDGGWATQCRLIGGQTRDFNLMVRAGVAGRLSSTRSRMVRAEPGFRAAINAASIIAVYAHGGAVSGWLDDEPFAWPAASLVWRRLQVNARFTLDAGCALVMEMDP